MPSDELEGEMVQNPAVRSFAYDLELGRFTQAGERWLEGLIDHQEWDRLRRRFRREEKRERKARRGPEG